MNETELDRLIRERRSIRKFKPDVPPKELVDAVAKAGLLAPTGRNQGSTVVIRIGDPALREAIVRTNAEIMGAPPPGRPADPFYGAPVILLVIASKARAETAVHDGSLALGNMMLKAHELGLGACWIHRAAQEMDTPAGRAVIEKAGLSDREWIGVGHLALGYADQPLPAPRPYDPSRYITV
ncbi:MAG: nitroreductase [Kiritimatiellae bacterium]|nr:nitroreductase [Kiritimatiellia bacterium]